MQLPHMRTRMHVQKHARMELSIQALCAAVIWDCDAYEYDSLPLPRFLKTHRALQPTWETVRYMVRRPMGHVMPCIALLVGLDTTKA